jgi:two-component sensor histidine kinase
MPLADEIVGNFPNNVTIKIEKNIDEFLIDAKTIFYIGIIINELLTNIMKYAFAGRNSGIISIIVKKNSNKVTIEIQDDGIGINESIDFNNSCGFGLRIIGMMTRQLKGNVKIERDMGTKFILEFNLPNRNGNLEP